VPVPRDTRSRIRHVLRSVRDALEPNPPRFPAAAAPDQRFTFNVAGIALELPRDALTPRVWRALAEGWYEDAELEAVTAVLRPDDVVLELGAAVGVVSAFVARRPGVRRVVAVEANPRLVALARRTHELNGTGASVDLVNAVVTADADEADFYLCEDFWASSMRPVPGAKRVRLPARSFPSLLAEAGPGVLIADIEGGEAELFRGAQLPGVRAVVMELHPEVVGLEGVARAFAHMASAGLVYDPRPSCRHVVVFARP
jgi:FkbM family methyltransferase